MPLPQSGRRRELSPPNPEVTASPSHRRRAPHASHRHPPRHNQVCKTGVGGNPLTGPPRRSYHHPHPHTTPPPPLTAFILAVHVPGHLVRQRHAAVQPPPPAPRRRRHRRRGARGRSAERRLGRGLLRLAAPAARAAPAPALGASRRGRRRPRGLRGHFPGEGGGGEGTGGGRGGGGSTAARRRRAGLSGRCVAGRGRRGPAAPSPRTAPRR